MNHVAQDHTQRRSELSPGNQSGLFLQVGSRRIRGLIGPLVEDGAFPARSIYQVQPSANWPAAFLDLIRTVIIAVRGPHGKKVGQLQQGLRHIVPGRLDHALLRSLVRSGRRRQLARRWVQKSRLISEQLESQRRLGARIQISGESGERSLSQPFGKL